MRERSLRRSLVLTFTAGFRLAPICTLPSPGWAQSTPFSFPTPAQDPHALEMEKASFSGKRMFLTALGGALVGSLVAYVTYSALCDENSDDGCLGAAITGWVANFAVTPAAVKIAGDALGGKGTMWSSYLGAAAALAPFSVTCPTDPETYATDPGCVRMQFVVSTLALPVTSALMYELSSHFTVERWKRERVQLGISPLVDRSGRPNGGYAAVGLAF